jgi:hypothetical protein
MTFSDLSGEQQKAIISLREKTTYLWLGFEWLLNEGGDKFSCNMRPETIDIIQQDLNILVGAGFFKINKDPQKDDHLDVLDLNVLDVSDDFMSVIKSMVSPSPDNSTIEGNHGQINPKQHSFLSLIISKIGKLFS